MHEVALLSQLEVAARGARASSGPRLQGIGDIDGVGDGRRRQRDGSGG